MPIYTYIDFEDGYDSSDQSAVTRGISGILGHIPSVCKYMCVSVCVCMYVCICVCVCVYDCMGGTSLRCVRARACVEGVCSRCMRHVGSRWLSVYTLDVSSRAVMSVCAGAHACI